MYKLTVYIPEAHVEQVKSALFEAGAGRYANYDCCAWQVLGQGQFRPLEGSKPFLGRARHIERVPEYRVEMIVADAAVAAVLAALKAAHPYEAPAYDLVQVLTRWPQAVAPAHGTARSADSTLSRTSTPGSASAGAAHTRRCPAAAPRSGP